MSVQSYNVPTSELVQMSYMYAAAELTEWDEFAGSGAYVHTTLFGRPVRAEVLRRDSHEMLEVAGLDGMIFYVRIDQITPVSPEESAEIELSEARRMSDKARMDRVRLSNAMSDAWTNSDSWEYVLTH